MFEKLKTRIALNRQRRSDQRIKLQRAYDRGVDFGYRQAKERSEARSKFSTPAQRITWTGGHYVGRGSYKTEVVAKKISKATDNLTKNIGRRFGD